MSDASNIAAFNKDRKIGRLLKWAARCKWIADLFSSYELRLLLAAERLGWQPATDAARIMWRVRKHQARVRETLDALGRAK